MIYTVGVLASNMSKNAQYIEINVNITLNKWKDGTADTRSASEMQELKNYIPGTGEIKTRKGITLFTYTT